MKTSNLHQQPVIRRSQPKPKIPLPKTMRINRFIALCTELSRRKAEEMITAKRVIVNGTTVENLATVIDPLKDAVRVDGKRLCLPQTHVYLAFHKPYGTLVTKSDPHDRKTIWDYLETWKARLNSAGRLDYDAEGLLLLSSDGDFLQRLAHPRHQIWKTYHVKVKGCPTLVTLQQLRDGVHLRDGKTFPAKVKLLEQGPTSTWIEIAIHEGKNRQVKRMCEEVGHAVIKLRRIAFGPISIVGLKAGKWRFLKPSEVMQLNQESRSS